MRAIEALEEYRNPRSYLTVAEIGVNHNGSVEKAIELCTEAKAAGATFVKFQKRDPEQIPDHMKLQPKDTPWGNMTYLEYKHRIELSSEDYRQIDAHCRTIGIRWGASVWDHDSVQFLVDHNQTLPFIKISSAKAVDHQLVSVAASHGVPLFISVGGMTVEDISSLRAKLDRDFRFTPYVFLFCRAIYPPSFGQIALNQLGALRNVVGAVGPYKDNLGYSGHERSNFPSLIAASRGVRLIERHFTLDTTAWGSDHKISLLPREFMEMTHRLDELELIDGSYAPARWAPHPSEIGKLSTQRAP